MHMVMLRVCGLQVLLAPLQPWMRTKAEAVADTKRMCW